MKKITLRGALFLGVLFVVCSASLISSAAWADCSPGDTAQVLWKGTWYPATVLKAKGTECFIHYTGYGSNWDEWVGPDRIKVTGSAPAPVAAASFSEGDAVQVLWKGT